MKNHLHREEHERFAVHRLVAVLGLVLGISLGLPGSASARAGPVDVELRLTVRSVPESLTEAEVHGAMTHAAHVWSHPSVPCTALRIRVGPVTQENKVNRDGLSLVVFRNRSWCHNERCGSGRTFPLAAAAMTTPLSADGRLEADIELNGASYAWNDAPRKRGQRQADLSIVLAHEVGHLLGLGDACGTVHGAPAGTDCADQDSIMYAPSLLSAPSPRDIAEICRLYPSRSQRAELAVPASTRASTIGQVLLIVAACLLGVQVYGTRGAAR